jgi:hypothetical protein
MMDEVNGRPRDFVTFEYAKQQNGPRSAPVRTSKWLFLQR